jgi:hypothetical protein
LVLIALLITAEVRRASATGCSEVGLPVERAGVEVGDAHGGIPPSCKVWIRPASVTVRASSARRPGPGGPQAGEVSDDPGAIEGGAADGPPQSPRAAVPRCAEGQPESPQALAALERREAETATLPEALAIDFGRLLRAAVPDLDGGAYADAKSLADLGVVQCMERAGAILLHRLGPEVIRRCQAHAPIFEALYREADVLSLQVALTPERRCLIGERALAS